MSDGEPRAGHGRTAIYTARRASDMLNAAGNCHLPPYLRRALEYAALGYTAEGHAHDLGIKTKTAEHYRQQAMKRLNAGSISSAVFLAAMLGLLFTDY